MALVSLQSHAPINYDNFSKNIVQLPSGIVPECTLLLYDLSFFFLFCFFKWFFFSFCANTSSYWNQEAHNFLMTYLIFIKQNSQNRFVKTKDSEIWNQNRKIYFKNTMELMWWNLCRSSTQIWTQTKKKNAQEDQIKTEFRLGTQNKTRNK